MVFAFFVLSPEDASGKVTLGSYPRIGTGGRENQPRDLRFGTFSLTLVLREGREAAG